MIQAILTIGIGALVLVLWRLAILVSLPQLAINATSVFSVFLDWGVMIWVVLVAVVTVWRATATPGTRARYHLVAAVIGAVAGLVIWAIPVIGIMGFEVLFVLQPQAFIRHGGVVVAGVIGAFAAAAIVGRVLRPRPSVL